MGAYALETLAATLIVWGSQFFLFGTVITWIGAIGAGESTLKANKIAEGRLSHIRFWSPLRGIVGHVLRSTPGPGGWDRFGTEALFCLLGLG